MPMISYYECDTCEECFHTGWGSRVYVVDANGQRHVCPHPGEDGTADWILEPELTQFQLLFGKEACLKILRKKRMGVEGCYVCLDCAQVDWVDPENDELACKDCNTVRLRAASELVGKNCPKCKSGAVVQRSSGMMS